MYCHVMFGFSWGAQQTVSRNQATSTTVFSLPSLPVAEHAGTVSSPWAEFRIPTALLSVPLSLQPAKGACLLHVSPQNWGTQYVAQTTSSLGHISTHAFSLFHWIPSHRNRSWPSHFSSYLPASVWTFLTALVVQEFFCQAPAKYQWKLFHV